MARAQGALEYLLLIGGAVLVVTIVIAMVTGIANRSAENIKQRIPTSFSGPNLVVNTSFEEWEPYFCWRIPPSCEKPKGWDHSTFDPEKSTSEKHSGNYSMYFHDETSAPRAWWEWFGIRTVATAIPNSLVKGKNIKATFYVKGDPSNVAPSATQWCFNTAPHFIDAVANGGATFGCVTVDLRDAPTPDWRMYTVTASIPATETRDIVLAFPIRVGFSAGTTPNRPTKVWVDDVQVEILKS